METLELWFSPLNIERLHDKVAGMVNVVEFEYDDIHVGHYIPMSFDVIFVVDEVTNILKSKSGGNVFIANFDTKTIIKNYR